MSGLIVTPPSDVVLSSRKKRVLRSIRRSLASNFEEDADEAPRKKSRRIAAETDEEDFAEGSVGRTKFVVLEDD